MRDYSLMLSPLIQSFYKWFFRNGTANFIRQSTCYWQDTTFYTSKKQPCKIISPSRIKLQLGIPINYTLTEEKDMKLASGDNTSQKVLEMNKMFGTIHIMEVSSSIKQYNYKLSYLSQNSNLQQYGKSRGIWSLQDNCLRTKLPSMLQIIQEKDIYFEEININCGKILQISLKSKITQYEVTASMTQRISFWKALLNYCIKDSVRITRLAQHNLVRKTGKRKGENLGIANATCNTFFNKSPTTEK